MPLTKIEKFKSEEKRLSLYAKALAHPARVAILRTLARKSACICGEIVEVLPLAQATVSQHLKELKRAKLVSGTVEGSASCYCLNREGIDELARSLEGFFNDLLDGCGEKNCSTKRKSG